MADSNLESMASQLRYLLDRFAIDDVIGRWGRGVDRHDAELIESSFWPDAQINYLTAFSGSPREFSTWANDVHERRMIAHQHHLTSHSVDLDGETAHAETYVIALLRTPDGKQLINASRIIDRLERRSGEWRISVREFIPEMSFESESGFNSSGVPEFAEGKWGRTDLSFLRPLPRRPASEK